MWSAEYSAEALPSRCRAAPAKNAVLSTVPGTSKPVDSRIGLPVWRGLGLGELLGALVEQPREPVQSGRALGRGRPAPLGIRPLGRVHRQIGVVRVTEYEVGDTGAVRRIRDLMHDS